MSEEYGTKETQELLGFTIKFINAINISLKDGKMGWGDLKHFNEPLKSALAAFKGIDKVYAELEDLSDAELEKLRSYGKETLELSENTEAIIDKAISASKELCGLYQLIQKQ